MADDAGDKWRKAKRQARDIKHRKYKRAAIRKLLGSIKEALR